MPIYLADVINADIRNIYNGGTAPRMLLLYCCWRGCCRYTAVGVGAALDAAACVVAVFCTAVGVGAVLYTAVGADDAFCTAVRVDAALYNAVGVDAALILSLIHI